MALPPDGVECNRTGHQTRVDAHRSAYADLLPHQVWIDGFPLCAEPDLAQRLHPQAKAAACLNLLLRSYFTLLLPTSYFKFPD